MRIRNVKSDDIVSFIEVYQKSYSGLEKYAYTRRKDIKHYFKWLYNRDSDGFLLAEINNRVVGFVACDANWISFINGKKIGEIHELFVLPQFRRKHIGTSLLIKAISYARKKGRKFAELWVGKENYVAIRFYKKFGFQESGSVGIWLRMTKEL